MIIHSEGETVPQIYTDPATGRQYTVDANGASRWIEEMAPLPPQGGYPHQVQQQQAMPGYALPQHQEAPKRKTHKVRNTILGVVGGLFAIGLLGSLFDGGDTQTTSTATASSKPGKTAAKKIPEAAAKVGTPVRDGKFEFTVTGIKTATKVGNEYMNKTAQGRFVLVAVTVSNIGDESQIFDSSAQKAFDTSGREYSADGEAGVYLGDEGNAFLNEINPGNGVRGTLVFDVPTSVDLASLELHDSLFSGGVKVSLAR